MNPVHVVLPAGVDDPTRPSGGNVYDRRVCRELTAAGWPLLEYAVPPTALERTLHDLPDGAVVLVDGLLASAAPDAVTAHAARLRVVVLVHLPFGVESPAHRAAEAAMLAQVAAVVATSDWTRTWLRDHYALPGVDVRVAAPGADPAGVAAGTPTGGHLLCVGAVTPTKGHDLLLDALCDLDDLAWRCTWVGSLEIEPAFVAALRDRTGRAGLDDRIVLAGPLVGAALDAAYQEADVLVLPSRAETFGMVVTEALAHGLPTIAARTGGVPETLAPAAPGGAVPGLLVPPDDAPSLAAALRSWLGDDGLRADLRRAASARRSHLAPWTDTARHVAETLAAVPA